MNLKLEQNAAVLTEPVFAGGTILVTPPLDEDYWLLRVQVGGGQSIVLFPKFGVFGIGFAKEEEDWNTNLPSSTSAKEIYAHIECNKGDDNIPKKRCVEAIQMLQKAILKLKGSSGADR